MKLLQLGWLSAGLMLAGFVLAIAGLFLTVAAARTGLLIVAVVLLVGAAVTGQRWAQRCQEML